MVSGPPILKTPGPPSSTTLACPTPLHCGTPTLPCRPPITSKAISISKLNRSLIQFTEFLSAPLVLHFRERFRITILCHRRYFRESSGNFALLRNLNNCSPNSSDTGQRPRAGCGGRFLCSPCRKYKRGLEVQSQFSFIRSNTFSVTGTMMILTVNVSLVEIWIVNVAHAPSLKHEWRTSGATFKKTV